MERTIILKPGNIGSGVMYSSEHLLKAVSRKGHRSDGRFIEVKCPNFTSIKNWHHWCRHHFPKKEVERFLTASLGRGRVRIKIEMGIK